MPRFSVGVDGRIGLSGLVGAGAPDAELREAVQAGLPGATLIWEARGVDGPYCNVFDTIHPIAETGSAALNVGLRDGVTRLNADQFVVPIVNMPDFPAHLQVDYFSHDGSVAHLFPVRGAANPVFTSNATVKLGLDQHGKPNLEVGAPFGTDMIVAVASSAPLIRRPCTRRRNRTDLSAGAESGDRGGRASGGEADRASPGGGYSGAVSSASDARPVVARRVSIRSCQSGRGTCGAQNGFSRGQLKPISSWQGLHLEPFDKPSSPALTPFASSANARSHAFVVTLAFVVPVRCAGAWARSDDRGFRRLADGMRDIEGK